MGSAYTNAVDDIHSTLEPIDTKNAVVICSFSMLREIEASLILGRCISFDDAAQTVSITLPASKTDPVAFSVTRTWGCVCIIDKEGPCPYHAAKAQQHLLDELFSDRDVASLPFLPYSLGWGRLEDQIH